MTPDAAREAIETLGVAGVTVDALAEGACAARARAMRSDDGRIGRGLTGDECVVRARSADDDASGVFNER